MRVIAGQLRGRKLMPPSDQKIRPTSDRVRETLFNMLQHGVDIDFDGAVVADIFSGTGALGIEALSRGADRVSFIDLHPSSLDLLRQNLASLGLVAQAKIIRGDARSLPRATTACDLLFLDPPYGQALIPPVLAMARTQGWIKPGSVLVMETAAGEDLSLPDWLMVEKDRVIGDTRIMITIAS